jgi:4-hydroxyphenylacetaldehyde oxime monooxygenase
MGKLASAAGLREPVFLEDLIFGCMDDIIGTVAFGNIYGAEQFMERQHFRDVINEAMMARSSFCAEDYFPNALGRLVDRLTGVVSRREMVFREFDTFFETIIEHHLDPSRVIPDQGGDLIDDLIDTLMEEHQGSPGFGRERVKALLSVRNAHEQSNYLILTTGELIKYYSKELITIFPS